MKLLLSVVLLVATMSARASVEIQINQLQFSYPAPVRMANVLQPVANAADWYWPASAVYNLDKNQAEQLRQEVLSDIQALLAQASPQDDDYLVLSAMAEQITAWSVADRIDVAVNYNEARLFVDHNPQFTDGNYLVRLTARPDDVHLVGAVIRPGSYAHTANTSIPDYLERLRTLEGAERDYVYVVTPAGQVEKVGIAYWNASYAQLAPGSQLIVPLASSVWSPAKTSLNKKIAQLAVHRVLP
ncbi:capsule biosynthesis GfcC family protein [Alteromonas sp. ASW11-19]|uniref:Capsule biosynthesis GfcC family protein n=1 Tax=Alteromonas salexigens TaxID=2982530 RepID=A0ABT2VPL4_9ALTE|nr:capsule biosynthesis GfcC family protein [Alteromonas salexigens]MCU7554813.1 capsule biosynthesis GfcC family protein [Alteromonas salexigens]